MNGKWGQGFALIHHTPDSLARGCCRLFLHHISLQDFQKPRESVIVETSDFICHVRKSLPPVTDASAFADAMRTCP